MRRALRLALYQHGRILQMTRKGLEVLSFGNRGIVYGVRLLLWRLETGDKPLATNYENSEGEEGDGEGRRMEKRR